MTAFTFTHTPDNGFAIDEQPRVLLAKFGDGYEQRVGDGINLRPRKYSLTFNTRTDAEIAPILAFLRARNGTQAFDWTPSDGSGAGVFACRQWQHTVVRFGINNLTATFEEVWEV